MKALVLAAGQGTRLKPFTDSVPKPMVDVAGRPMLEYILEQIRSAGIAEVWMNLHYKPEIIRDHFDDGKNFDMRIRYSFEKELLGTAGAVKKLETEFKETFMVYYGDNYVEVNLNEMIHHHQKSGVEATVALFPTETPHMSGIAQLDADDTILRFVEKPGPADAAGNLANAGIYIMEPSVIRSIPADRPSDFGRDIFPELLRQRRAIKGYRLSGSVIGIDTPELHARLESYLSRRKSNS